MFYVFMNTVANIEFSLYTFKNYIYKKGVLEIHGEE